MKQLILTILIFPFLLSAAYADSIWGAANGTPATATMRIPVDTSSSSSPTYIDVADIEAFIYSRITADDITEGATYLFLTTTERSKLTGIETSATADQSDAEIETAYNNQVAACSQGLVEAGVSTAICRITPERVSQAIDALGFSGAYADLTGKPTLFSGAYDDLTDKPTIPTDNSSLANGAGYITATLTDEQVEDYIGAMLTGNTETGITVTYQDTDGTIDFVVSGGGGGAVDSVNGDTGTVVLDADDIDDTSASHKFVTSSDLTNLSNLSGTNTGDQTTITGNAGTATALAANGGNCSAGSAPLGVNASGAVESCFDVWTEAENTSAAYSTFSGAYADLTGKPTLFSESYDDLTDKPTLTSEVEANANTSYTFVLADSDDYERFTSGSAVTATVPPNSTTAFPVDTELQFIQAGAGQVTVAAGAGVTINSSETLKLRTQYSAAILKKVATNEWDLIGDLEESP